MERIIEPTADGSATLFVPALNEHYHSVKGARTESEHIFVHLGLNASPVASPHIVEVGFGTGLNAWLTLIEAERAGRHVTYTAWERYPLPRETAEALGYARDAQLPPAACGEGNTAPADLFRRLHDAPWDEEVPVTPHFTLRKVHADFTRAEAAGRAEADIVYFDAFAPEKQPEMWTEAVFARLFALLRPGGLLTTYCAKGAVRRGLQAAGFTVERLPGPPSGKREVLRAWKAAAPGGNPPPRDPNGSRQAQTSGIGPIADNIQHSF